MPEVETKKQTQFKVIGNSTYKPSKHQQKVGGEPTTIYFDIKGLKIVDGLITFSYKDKWCRVITYINQSEIKRTEMGTVKRK